MNLFDVFFRHELDDLRVVLEGVAELDPSQIWDSLLRFAVERAGASAARALDREGGVIATLGSASEAIEALQPAVVQRALRMGRTTSSAGVILYPLVHRRSVLGAMAMHVPGGSVAEGIAHRVASVLSTAALILSAARGADAGDGYPRAGSAQAGEQRPLETLPGLVAESDVMQAVVKKARAYAKEEEIVLISGEPGVGKDMVAVGIHEVSCRKGRPFHEVDLTALSETLFESGLFGATEGCATSVRGHDGQVSAAKDGTLFLNEVGEVPMALQPKLLRFLQKRVFHRVGSTRLERSTSRVLVATNRDLRGMVRAGTFRQDLYDRLNVLPLRVPPLRERREDIPWFVRHFSRRRAGSEVAPGAMVEFMEGDWPGNVRQLENAVAKLLILGKGFISEAAAREEVAACGNQEVRAPVRQEEVVRIAKTRSLAEAMIRRNGDKEQVAGDLGISVRAVEKQLRQFDLRR